MSVLIVADTGPLVILAKLDHLPLLRQLYAEIHIPETVLTEATTLAYRQDAKRIVGFVAQTWKKISHLISLIKQKGVHFMKFFLDCS